MCEIHTALLRYTRRLEANYVGQSHGKNAYDSCLPKAVSVLGLQMDLLGAQAERSRSAT